MRLLAALLILLLGLPVLGNEALGWKQVVYQLNHPNTARLTELAPAYRNLGYDQSPASADNMRVRVELTPLAVSAPLPVRHLTGEKAPEHLGVGPIALGSIQGKLAGLLKSSDTLYELLDGTLTLAGKAFPQDRPDCVKRAELAVYLLQQVGVEARTVTGIRMDEAGATRLEGPALHRWVELHLPGKGWVFSDPGQYHFFVPPEYVFLGITRELKQDTFRNLAGGELVRVYREGALAGMELQQAPLKRGNAPAGGLLICRLEGLQADTLWLDAQPTGQPAGESSSVDGWAAFGPLPDGTYRVRTRDRAWQVNIDGGLTRQVVLK